MLVLGAIVAEDFVQAAEPLAGQREQDDRDAAPTATPRVFLVVNPSVRPIQQPDRNPADAISKPTSSIALRALAVRDVEAAGRAANTEHEAADKIANRQGGSRTSQASAAQAEVPRVRSPIVPAPSAEVVKTPPAQFDLDSRPIGAVTTNIRCRQGDLPQNTAPAKLAAMREQPYNELIDREWDGLCYQWEAPALRHQPLYFEEVNLERYGYCWPGLKVVQPALSGAQFFATLPLLPYKIWCEPPRECDYTLGQYRPGSPAPYQVQLPCWRPGAGAAEAGAVAGLILLIP